MCGRVAAIKAIGGVADNIELDQPGFWQGSYTGPFGAEYVGPFAGVSHMMMIEDNGARDATASPRTSRSWTYPRVGEQEHQAARGNRVRVG